MRTAGRRRETLCLLSLPERPNLDQLRRRSADPCPREAARILEAHPNVASHNISAAAAFDDVDAVGQILTASPSAAILLARGARVAGTWAIGATALSRSGRT